MLKKVLCTVHLPFTTVPYHTNCTKSTKCTSSKHGKTDCHIFYYPSCIHWSLRAVRVNITGKTMFWQLSCGMNNNTGIRQMTTTLLSQLHKAQHFSHCLFLLHILHTHTNCLSTNDKSLYIFICCITIHFLYASLLRAHCLFFICALLWHTQWLISWPAFFFLQRLDHLYYINCWMMRKMKTNFCLITLQTNSPSIRSYVDLMWWIHFIARQHLHASIPITSHLLVMKSHVRATSAAQGEINCLVRNTYHNICTHGYQHCIDTSKLCTSTYAFHRHIFLFAVFYWHFLRHVDLGKQFYFFGW